MTPPKLAPVPGQHIELTRKATISGVTYIKSGRFKKRYTGNKQAEIDINGKLWVNGAELREHCSSQGESKFSKKGKKKPTVETAGCINHNKFVMVQRYINLSTLQPPLSLTLRVLSTIKPQRTYRVKKSLIRQRLLGFINTQAGKKELYFWTVTFPQGTPDNIAYKAYNIWLTRLRQTKMLKNYLWVAERQENGTVHFHIAIPHKMSVQRANIFMRDTLKKFCQSGEIPYSVYAIKRYNGVDIAKHRTTKRVTNFAIKKGSKALSWYLTKYVTKNDTDFSHLAWHNSRGFSALWLGVTFSMQEFAINKLHYHLNFTKKFENDWVIFVPWFGEPPDIFTKHLFELNSYFQLLSNN